MQPSPLSGLIVVVMFLVAPLGALAQRGGPPSRVGQPTGIGPPESRGGLPSGASARAGVAADRDLSAVPRDHRTQARERWRAHREQLDFDPQGQLIVRGEVVGLAASPQAVASVQAGGFTVKRQDSLDDMGMAIVVFGVPRGMAIDRALEQIRSADPQGTYDFNHIYLESGDVPAGGTAAAGQGSQTGAKPNFSSRIGLLDGAVEAHHPALSSATVHTSGCKNTSAPTPHGTAVASRLMQGIGRAGTKPQAVDLYVVDIFCGAPTGGSVDAFIEGLAWLMRERIPVINVSLVGPTNKLLERVVDMAIERGHLIVAAVGNDGPAAPPLFPAAYPGVVSVTGVSRSHKVLPEAGRGPFVTFAAPGADIVAALLPDGFGPVRGTSFAAPIVAGLLALQLERPDPQLARQAVEKLVASAMVLGAPGLDPVYGYGCVGCSW